MSEGISAFEAYKAKIGTAGIKVRKSPKKPGIKKKFVAASKKVSIKKTTPKKGAIPMKVEVLAAKSNGVKNILNKKNAAKPKSAAKTTTKESKPNEAPKKATSNGEQSKSRSEKNFSMVADEYLLLSKKGKLTNEQQKKKKEMEDILVRVLENGNAHGDGQESSAFSEEYTLNGSHYQSECYSSEEETTAESKSGSKTHGKSGSGFQSNSSLYSLGSPSSLEQNCVAQNKVKSKSNTKANCSQNNKSSKRKSNAEKPCDDVSKPKSSKNDSFKQKSAVDAVECNGGVDKRHSDGESYAQSKNPNVSRCCLKLEPLSPQSNVAKMNSVTEGLKLFRWLLNPVDINDFYTKYFERNACLVKRQKASYFSHLISFEAIDQMLLNNHVEFTKNIDVTLYKNGVRETLNPNGRAMPPVVWEYYGNGCSLRLLNPQTFIPALYSLNATLQEYFHCLVGANAYLTPPNSQGFAPHYDDIEAFVLQIEGRKRWKLYQPRNKSEHLPRFSSKNFNENEIGKPILEEVLHPGDILYFPRGTIHQACTEPGYHSLHITLSVYQKQSFADLFESMMPLILKHAIANNVEMRRGLPLHTWRNAGIAFSGVDSEERGQLLKNVSRLLTKSIRDIPLAEFMDAAVDQVAKKFQREALPPEILPAERARTIFGSGSQLDETGECLCDYVIDLRTNVRLLRANILRLVNEENSIRLYYYVNNSKQYCEYEQDFIEIIPEDAGSVEVLIKSYPAYVSVSQLPIEDEERKISIVTALWESGLLMLEKPLNYY